MMSPRHLFNPQPFDGQSGQTKVGQLTRPLSTITQPAGIIQPINRANGDVSPKNIRNSPPTDGLLTWAEVGRDRTAFSASANELWNCPSRPRISDRMRRPENPLGAERKDAKV